MYRASNSWLRPSIALALALSAGRPVFNADLYVIDGGSGKTRAVVDWNDDDHRLDQANTTLQCVLPAAHADFAGGLCLTFVHTAPNWYESNRAASYWRYQSDGTGLWNVLAATPTDVASTRAYYATTSGSGTGHVMFHTSTPSLFAQTQSGPSTFPINTSRAIVADSPMLVDYSYREGDSPEFRLKVTGQAAITGNSSAPPDAGDPVGPLRLGARPPSAAAPGSFRFAFGMFASAPPAPAQRETLEQYFLQTYGLAA